MRRKGIPVIVALVLIVIVAVVGFGSRLLEKYSYSKEVVDLDEYYGVEEGELAILLQNDMISDRAYVRDGRIYFELNTVKTYLNEGFYADRNEQKILYTTALDTATAVFGAREYTDSGGGLCEALYQLFMAGIREASSGLYRMGYEADHGGDKGYAGSSGRGDQESYPAGG